MISNNQWCIGLSIYGYMPFNTPIIKISLKNVSIVFEIRNSPAAIFDFLCEYIFYLEF